MTVLWEQVRLALKYFILAIAWNICTVKTKHLGLGLCASTCRMTQEKIAVDSLV